MDTVSAILIILGGLFICFAGYQVVRIWSLARESSVLIAKVVPYEQHLTNPDRKILFLGDSTAVGVGSKDAKDTVAGRFGTLYPRADISNKGISGQKINQLSAEFDPVKTGKVDLLVIQIGANDIIRLTNPKAVERDLKVLLANAAKVSDAVVILHSGNIGLSPLFPKVLGPIWSARTRTIRDMYIKEAAATGAKYVDLYREKEDDVYSKDPEKYYAKDSLHLSGEGYGVWFGEIEKVL